MRAVCLNICFSLPSPQTSVCAPLMLTVYQPVSCKAAKVIGSIRTAVGFPSTAVMMEPRRTRDSQWEDTVPGGTSWRHKEEHIYRESAWWIWQRLESGDAPGFLEGLQAQGHWIQGASAGLRWRMGCKSSSDQIHRSGSLYPKENSWLLLERDSKEEQFSKLWFYQI